MTVDANEADNNVLTVRASSVTAPGVYGEITITVENFAYAIKKIVPGSTDTVKIDGIEWYVLAKDGDKALLWAKENSTAWGSRAFGGSNNWKISTVKS